MVKKRTIITITEFDNADVKTHGIFVQFEQAPGSSNRNIRGANTFISNDKIKSSELSKEELIKNAIKKLRNDIQKGE